MKLIENSNKFIFNRLCSLFIPVFLGEFGGCIADTIDGSLAGIFFNEDAIAGIGLVFPILFMIYFIGSIVSVGACTRYTQNIGKGDKNAAYKIMGESLFVSFLLGVISALFLIVLKNPYFSLYEASSDIIFYANNYYSWIIPFSAVFPCYCLIANSVLNDGDILFYFLGEIVRFIVKVLLTLLFLMRFENSTSALSMGTLFSVIFGIIVVSCHMLRKCNTIKYKFQFNHASINNNISIGLFISLPYLLCGLMAYVNSVYISSLFGEIGLTIHSITTILVGYLSIWLSLEMASNPIFSVYYGEKNYQQCKSVSVVCFKISLIGGILTAIVYNIFAPFVPMIFNISSPSIMELSIFASRIIGIFAVTYIVIIVMVEVFSISNKQYIGALASCLYQSIIPILLIMLLSQCFGVVSIIYSYAVAPLITMIITAIVLLIKYKWSDFPFYFPKNNASSFNFACYVNNKNAMSLSSLVYSRLEEYNINPFIINKIIIVIEETCCYIRMHNAKKIILECNIVYEKDSITLIMRDNGAFFDINKEDLRIDSLNTYLLDCLTDSYNCQYLPVVNYNRNIFRFSSE